jgi:hypothetical protein
LRRRRLRCRHLEVVPASPARPLMCRRMNRLAAETSPYLLQHADNPVASASLAMPAFGGRAGFAGATVDV